MEHDAALATLFDGLDALAGIARGMHPRQLNELIAGLGDSDALLRAAIGSLDPASAIDQQICLAAELALQAYDGLRAAPDAENPLLQVSRAMRQYSRSLEALAALAELVPAVGRYCLEPRFRDDPALPRRLAEPAHPQSGVFHSDNETTQRGGFSVYVPPWYEPSRPVPIVVALHGGSGHGRLFLWNWLNEARARGIIVVAPTAMGSTWSLMQPEIDSNNLREILHRVRRRWSIDANHMLLMGMSDGGTFTLLSGLADDSPFTHLAPVAAAFHPMLLATASPRRLAGLPIHLTHGTQDWMFPVDMARTAYRSLSTAGAAITYREIDDLSHAYPRDGQGEVLDWLLPTGSLLRPERQGDRANDRGPVEPGADRS